MSFSFTRLTKQTFSLRRRIDPPKHMRYGVFTATGEEHPFLSEKGSVLISDLAFGSLNTIEVNYKNIFIFN